MREYHYAIILRRKRFRSSCSAKVGTRAPPPPPPQKKKKKEEKRKNSTKGVGGGGVEDKRREISFSPLLLQVSLSLLFQLSRRTGTETLAT